MPGHRSVWRETAPADWGSATRRPARIWPVDPPQILLHLDPYLKQKKFNKADYWWSKYYQETADGRIFSLPLNAAAWGWIANVDLFERAGMKAPAPSASPRWPSTRSARWSKRSGGGSGTRCCGRPGRCTRAGAATTPR